MIELVFDKYTKVNSWNYDYNYILDKFRKEKHSIWYNLDINENIITECAESVRSNADVFIVIGIGGSYLGARAVIDSIRTKDTSPEIIYLGNNLSSDYINEILEYIKEKSVYVNVISKSGNTLETLISFKIILNYMINKYDDFKERIIVTTNSTTGELLEYVKKYNFKHLSLSNELIGRYSVFSYVGLLPMAVAGINISELIKGAKECKNNLEPCYIYSNYRYDMYNQGNYIESIDVYDDKLYYFTEWIKQLFNESQGKDNKGILTISTINPRDLHSIEQYYQAGKVKVFSTSIFNNNKTNIFIDDYRKSLNEINEIVFNSVIEARKDTMNIGYIKINEINEFNIGYLLFFFEVSSMISSYLLDIDYFNQPDIEKYKNVVKNGMN